MTGAEQAQLTQVQLMRAQPIGHCSTRYCAGCDEERPFEQFHAGPASCPDVADGDCPEWGCTVCGDALIIGLPGPRQAVGDRTTRAA